MKGWVVETERSGDDVIVELSDRVRHDAYCVDPQDVAVAVLRDVADSWEAFTQGRAHGRQSAEHLARRHAR
ncbi:MAG: hypothetical protein V9E83_09185 [Baekduia sp.]